MQQDQPVSKQTFGHTSVNQESFQMSGTLQGHFASNMAPND